MVKNARAFQRKLGRTWEHRLAMFRCVSVAHETPVTRAAHFCLLPSRNMATSLIEHERIRTTVPKAKELRRVVDKLITKGKNSAWREGATTLRCLQLALGHHSPCADTEHKRRQVAAYVRSTEAVDKVFQELAPRYM